MENSHTDQTYKLKLFITGQTVKSDLAIGNIHRIFDNLGIPLDLRIIDVLERPELAEEEKVIATPTLIKTSPLPVRRIIGDLSELKSVKIGLGLNIYENSRQ